MVVSESEVPPVHDGGLLIHSDPFWFVLLALEALQLHQTPHLQPNAYQVLTKNLSDFGGGF